MPEVITGEVVIAMKQQWAPSRWAGVAFVLEVHTEDELSWGGYARGMDPYASFKVYRKDLFELVEDRRV